MDIATANLMLQVLILALLFAGLFMRKRGGFIRHAYIMLVAVVLIAVSFFVVMGPSLWISLFDKFGFFALDPLGKFSAVTAVHAALGTMAELLGIWVVASWHLRSSFNKCSARRKMMRWTFYVWVTALIIGIVLYFLKYA